MTKSIDVQPCVPLFFSKRTTIRIGCLLVKNLIQVKQGWLMARIKAENAMRPDTSDIFNVDNSKVLW